MSPVKHVGYDRVDYGEAPDWGKSLAAFLTSIPLNRRHIKHIRYQLEDTILQQNDFYLNAAERSELAKWRGWNAGDSGGLESGFFQLFQDSKFYEVWKRGTSLTIPELLDGGIPIYVKALDEYRVLRLAPSEEIRPEATEKIRAIVIGEHLLSKIEEALDIQEAGDIKVTRLEGELRRWDARERKVPIKETQITPELVGRYCSTYNLSELQPFMLKALNLPTQ